MKKIFLLLSLCFAISAFAQNDTLDTGFGANMEFYNVSTGAKIISSNTDWEIAFSVRPALFPYNTNQSAAVRINEANGLKLYRSPSQKLDVWSTFDTTGYTGWQQMHNPDTTWKIGAFNINKNFNDPYNYGWCEYSGAPLHELAGDSSIYLIVMPDGSFRKLALLDLIYDTAFHFQFDKLDNSDFTTQEVRKIPYQPKMFVYYDLNAKVIRDKEPAISTWDMVFLRYNSTGSTADITADFGILTNDMNSVYAASGSDAQQNCYNGAYSNYINVIGKTWRDTTTYLATPGLAYFVSGSISGDYRFIVTDFAASVTDAMSINITRCSQTGINAVDANSFDLTVYPVPASDMLHIKLTSENEADASIQLLDMSGRIILSKSADVVSGENNFSLSIAAVQSGNYILSVSSESGRVNKMVSVLK